MDEEILRTHKRMSDGFMNDTRASGIWSCRDIIDKYKAESEEA